MAVTFLAVPLINGIHAFVRAFPEIPVRSAEIGRYFTQKPWSVIGWTPLYILSFALGLGFLMPLEMSFSLWFFTSSGKGHGCWEAPWGWRVCLAFPMKVRKECLCGTRVLRTFGGAATLLCHVEKHFSAFAPKRYFATGA